MEKVRSMRAFFITERAVNYRFRSNWNYVGRHGADKFSTRYTRGLSGGQFTAHKARVPIFAATSPACNLPIVIIRSVVIVTA